jgi:hypothetical protein
MSHRPNLFLIGAMKSGTSYLSELLGAHPAIFMSAEREPTYFVDPQVLRHGWPRMWEQGYWKGEDRYLQLFAGAGDATIVAEGSTCYSKLPMYQDVPRRILEFNPQARFIYVMRDPVERTISHYWHRVGSSRERQPMLTAIQSDPEYTDVSYYAWQLSEYLKYVGRERIFVLTFEELRASPAEQMRRIYAWLGVDSSFHLPAIPAQHVTPEVVEQARGGGFLSRLRQSPSYARVAAYVPRAARKLGTRLAVQPVRREEVDTSKVKKYLRPLQMRQTQELAKLLGREFPEWKTLYAQGDQGEPGAALRNSAR